MKTLTSWNGATATATLLMAAGALLTGPASLDAQESDLSLGVFGGGMTFTELNNTDEGDFFGQEPVPDELDIETTGLVGVKGELWVHDRVAIRADAGFAPATLQVRSQDQTGADPSAGVETDVADMDIVLGDLAAVYRLLPEETTVTPYVTAGAGIIHYNPQGNTPIEVDDANAKIPLEDTESGNNETQLAGTVGLGASVSPDGWPVTVRGEVTDRIASSPARLFLDEDDPLGGGTGIQSNTDFDMVHNLGFTLGLQWVPGQG